MGPSISVPSRERDAPATSGDSPATGLRGRRLLSTRRRRAAVALLVAMLTLSMAAYDQVARRHESWNIEYPEPGLFDGLNIYTERTYTGLTGILVNGVSIYEGGSVRISGCDITVPYESLVIDNHWPFGVQDGASLTIEDTAIRVVVDANLTGAVFYRGYYYPEAWDPTRAEYPLLSRVVNLAGANRPVLSLNASWWQEEADLLVMGQALPSDGMTVIGHLHLPQMAPGEWRHLELGLDALKGSIARLALAPVARVVPHMLVSGLRVTDGGSPLPMDRPFTGDPAEDGWYLGGFRDFGHYEKYYHAAGLIYSWGSLTMERTTVTMPSGVPRWMQAEVVDGIPSVSSDIEASNQVIAPLGGNIHVGEGTLGMNDVRLENVPILASDSNLTIRDSSLAGDIDLMTLLRCGGSVEGSRFTFREPPPGTPNARDFPGNFRWGISAEGGMEGRPLLVRNSTFEGCEVAIDLNEALASVEQCSFKNISKVALWDHGVQGLGAWDAIARTNRFDDIEGHQYIRSHDCPLSYTGEQYPNEGSGWGTHAESVIRPAPPVLPSVRFIYGDVMGASFMLPTLLVEGDGTAHAVDEVQLRMYTDWGGCVEPVIQTSSTCATVRFTGNGLDLQPGQATLEAYLREWNPLWCYREQLTIPGEFVFEINLEAGDIMSYGVTDLHMGVFLDGALLDDIDIANETVIDMWGEADYNTTVAMSPGCHTLSCSITGNHPSWTGNRAFWNTTALYMRVTTLMTSSDVSDLFNETHGIVLLDPGAEMVLEHIEPYTVDDYYDGYWGWSLDLMMWERSRATLRDLAGNETSQLDLGVLGNGTVTMENVSCGDAYLALFGANMTVTGLECLALYPLIYNGSTLIVRGMKATQGIFAEWMEDSNLVIEDSDIDIDLGAFWSDPHPQEIEMGVYGCSVSLLNTTIETLGTDPAGISLYGLREMVIDGCTFERTGLFVPIRFEGSDLGEADVRKLEVGRCLFRGEGSYLVVPTYNRRSPLDILEGDITENSFVGPGAGMVVSSLMVPDRLADNELVGGAVAFHQFDLQPDLLFRGSSLDQPSLDWTPANWGEGPASYPLWLQEDRDTTLFMRNATADPLDIGGNLTLMVTQDGYTGPNFVRYVGRVVWFASIGPRDAYSAIEVPALPEVEMAVMAIIEPLLPPPPPSYP